MLGKIAVTVAVTLLGLMVFPKLRPIPLFFYFGFGIWVEKTFPSLFRHAFPRSTAEALDRPEQLFGLLLASGAVPSSARLQSVVSLAEAELTDEPDKNETSGGLRVTYTLADGGEKTLPLFLKFQCGRGLKLWLQAIRAALEPGISREIQFYRLLAGQVPMRVAKPYISEAAYWCNRASASPLPQLTAMRPRGLRRVLKPLRLLPLRAQACAWPSSTSGLRSPKRERPAWSVR